MATINLAPGTQYLALVRKRRRRLFLISFLLMIVLGGTWLGLLAYRNSLKTTERNLVDQLNRVETEIARLGSEGERVDLFEKRLAEVDQLLDSHFNWNVMFEEIQRLLPPPTQLTSTRISTDRGSLSLQGTTPDIDTVAQTIASLISSPEHPTIFTSTRLGDITRKEVSADAAAGTPGVITYEFSAELQFDPAVLRTNRVASQ